MRLAELVQAPFELGASPVLTVQIQGESLLNDGTAVVAFMVMQSVAGGCSTDVAGVAMSLVRLAGGGVGSWCDYYLI